MHKVIQIIAFGCVIVAVGCCYLWWHHEPRTNNRVLYERRFNEANAFFQAGEYDRALNLYQALLNEDTSYPVVYFNIGRVLAQKKQYEQAIVWYQKTLRIKAAAAPANQRFQSLVYGAIGAAYLALEQDETAWQALHHALEHDSSCADAQYQCGLIAKKRGELDKAFSYVQKAAELNHAYARELLSLGMAFRDVHAFDKALRCYTCAQQYGATSELYVLMGEALNLQSNHEQAFAMYQKATEIDKKCHEAYHNMGMILEGEYNRPDQALDYLLRAQELKPEYVLTHHGLAIAYLALGDYEKGWKEYEWRLRGLVGQPVYDKPCWNGVCSLQGKKVVVHAEQGLGDTLQFIRYAQLLKGQGAMVIAYVQKPLIKLLSRCPYLDAVIGQEDALPSYDLHVPLMSLPYLCKTRISTIPHEVPYLYPDPALVKTWHEKLATTKSLKVGVCWYVEASHDLNIYRAAGKQLSISLPKRSISVDLMLQLAELANVHLYSLQKNLPDDQRKALSKNNLLIEFEGDFDGSHGRFMDTAALMKSLDLVITADTSIAHLAGGLGVPVWVLLPFAADWRWLLKRSDSPWYPTMRLFRQPKPGDWASVIAQVKNAVQKMQAAR